MCDEYDRCILFYIENKNENVNFYHIRNIKMQSRNIVEKFSKTRKQQRDAMKKEGHAQKGRKLNKTKRGNDHWSSIEND